MIIIRMNGEQIMGVTKEDVPGHESSYMVVKSVHMEDEGNTILLKNGRESVADVFVGAVLEEADLDTVNTTTVYYVEQIEWATEVAEDDDPTKRTQ